MVEGFTVISGQIQSDTNLRYITDVAKDRYSVHTTAAHHEWINSVEPSEYRSALDAVRTDPSILEKIQEKFPTSSINSVTEADEIYWAVSPKGALGSDRSLVDCHYDTPFALFPTGGVIFYRVLIACNENNTVTTVFPNENVRVKMNTKDFHGLDYNKDMHCVEGSIPEGKYRVLLKLHYTIVPPGTEVYEPWVRGLNLGWTVFSRETMRMSADPKIWYEYIVAYIVNICRMIYKNFYTILIALFVISLFYYVLKPINRSRLLNRKYR